MRLLILIPNVDFRLCSACMIRNSRLLCGRDLLMMPTGYASACKRRGQKDTEAIEIFFCSHTILTQCNKLAYPRARAHTSTRQHEACLSCEAWWWWSAPGRLY